MFVLPQSKLLVIDRDRIIPRDNLPYCAVVCFSGVAQNLGLPEKRVQFFLHCAEEYAPLKEGVQELKLLCSFFHCSR